ncbi:RibD family protein [Jiella avicenniae]|uniref:RibD family protein n=1 Tax=Jiella avicenniae TaxID=2907202 RepID=A0A9X1P3G3_9HYPH|nr:RibD family protein [Jiella avicenniae]MCE7029581.1 RibD family protein [Jiella avicenniae]
MRPKITCHMITSLDGRLHPSRWSDPVDCRIGDLTDRHYDATAERLGAQGWIVGRRTMAEMSAETDAVALLDEPRQRPPHMVERNGRDLAVAVDPSGRLRFDTGEIGGDQVVLFLSERVPDEVLATFRETGVSYVFAGPDGHDMTAALKMLAEATGVEHLLLEGGGATNGAFLAAGLIDEVSTLICPAIDGLAGVPSIFDHNGEPDSRPTDGQHLRLLACETLEGGVVWLRHEIVHD